MKGPIESHLVISALGADRPTLVRGLAAAFRDCGCSIKDSRMAVLGSEFAMVLLLAGQWNAIAKAESMLPKLESELEISLQSRRTGPRSDTAGLIPYTVEVIAIDQPGIVHDVADFFARREINVEDLISVSYTAPHTGASMFSLHMTVGIPADSAIAAVRVHGLLRRAQPGRDADPGPLGGVGVPRPTSRSSRSATAIIGCSTCGSARRLAASSLQRWSARAFALRQARSAASGRAPPPPRSTWVASTRCRRRRSPRSAPRASACHRSVRGSAAIVACSQPRSRSVSTPYHARAARARRPRPSSRPPVVRRRPRRSRS